MRPFIATLFLSAFIALNSLGTKDIQTDTQIQSVFVYNSSAEILCQSQTTLPEGRSRVVIRGLSPHIVSNTLSVSITGDETGIISVSERINFLPPAGSEGPMLSIWRDSIESIHWEISMKEAEKNAAQAEMDLLFAGESIGGVANGVSVDEIRNASTFFSARYTQLAKKMRYTERQIRRLGGQLELVENQLREMENVSRNRTSEIIIDVTSGKQQEVSFNFKYLTNMAGWAPLYDFDYQGVNEPLNFRFHANVFNASGVDWDQVSIVLSTASPLAGFATPKLNSASQVQPKVGDVPFRQIEVVNTIVQYDIQEEYSIPSNAKPHLIYVEENEFAADFHYLIIPKLDPFGFLMADVPHWNRVNLIPGDANIYNNGSFMGKTFLNTYAENDTLNLYLGKERKVQANKREHVDAKRSGYIANYDTERTETELLITNLTDENLRVEIWDQVPYVVKGGRYQSGDKFNISRVEEAFYIPEEGFLAWNTTLAPSGTWTVEFDHEYKSRKGYRRGSTSVHHGRYRTISCPSF
jgi:hypothetical protein